MTITPTTLLSLPVLTTGTESGTWGDDVNNGLTQYLDICIAGTLALTSASFTSNALTLANTAGTSSATNIAGTTAQYYILSISSLAASVTITAPSSSRSYIVNNLDTTYNVTIKATGQSGVIIYPGEKAIVAFSSTDYVKVSSYAGVAALQLPKGTTAQQPTTNVSGTLRFNSQTGQFEGYSQQQTLASVTVTGIAGQCACTASTTTLVAGQLVIVTGTNTGSSTGISANSYYVIGSPTSTSFQLSATVGGSGVVTTAGTTTGLTFISYSWSSVGGAAISNDTTTATNEYPLFAAATSGTALTVYTSNAKLLYKPSTGDFQSEQLVAGNGLIINNQTINTSYSVPATQSAMSTGPITLASAVSVTLASGARWVIL
jgi:hypothetical protein